MDRSGRGVLVYDGECDLCVRSVAALRRRGGAEAYRMVPFQDPSVPLRFPEVPREGFERAVQLFTPAGERHEGAEAIARVLWDLPRYRPLSWLMGLPVVRSLARLGYRLVARNRARFGCGAHCPVDDPGGQGRGGGPGSTR